MDKTNHIWITFNLCLKFLCVTRCHPEAYNIEVFLICTCNSCQSSYIKVLWKLLKLCHCSKDLFLLWRKHMINLALLFLYLSIKLTNMLCQECQCLLWSTLILIRKAKTFKVKCLINSINLCNLILWAKIYAPYIILILFAFVKDRIDIIVRVLHKLFHVIDWDSSEAILYRLKCKQLVNIISQIIKWNNLIH